MRGSKWPLGKSSADFDLMNTKIIDFEYHDIKALTEADLQCHEKTGFSKWCLLGISGSCKLLLYWILH